MNENVAKFFELYNNDEELRRRIEQAEMMYPGSLEIREAVVEAVLLPEAVALGLPFTVKDLRMYETRKKLDRSMQKPGSFDRGEEYYWLVNRGWNEPDIK